MSKCQGAALSDCKIVASQAVLLNPQHLAVKLKPRKLELIACNSCNVHLFEDLPHIIRNFLGHFAPISFEKWWRFFASGRSLSMPKSVCLSSSSLAAISLKN